MSAAISAISVRELTVAYGKNKVIDKASFEIETGDFVCIVGANGSGKSTLVKALLGLIKPASGKITFGEGIAKTAIGYLPQETKSSQNFPATVSEIVMTGALGRLGKKITYRKEDRERVLETLKTLGIKKLAGERFGDLSGGQKQKVLLARALVATSRLLILDEPSNNLDHKSRKEFYETLKKLNSDGLTILMITHDLDADDLIGNKVLAIKDGKVQCATTEKFLEAYR